MNGQKYYACKDCGHVYEPHPENLNYNLVRHLQAKHPIDFEVLQRTEQKIKCIFLNSEELKVIAILRFDFVSSV